MNPRRVLAVFKRHYYMTVYSPPRILDTLFWPFVDILVWGYLTVFLREGRGALSAPLGFLIGGVLLWDLLFRTNLGIALTFLEESWSRNVVNLLASPLTPAEYLAGATLWALAKLVLGWVLIAALAWALFAFNVITVGPVLALFALALMVFGAALSLLVLGIVLRYGPGAEVLAWALAVLIVPLSAVFYPLSVLPGWAQGVATSLPPAHVFESMRAVLAGRAIPWGSLGAAFGLDAVYLTGAFVFAKGMFATLRRRGYVTRYM
jgi:ABC-2 type transport system permease protein